MANNPAQLSILFCAANHWQHSGQVGSHNLARAIVNAGYRVAFIGDPVSPCHLLAGKDIQARFRSYIRGGSWHLRKSLFSYVPFSLLAPAAYPLLNSQGVLKSWHKFAWPALQTVLQRNGFKRFAAVYVDSLKQAYWWRTIAHNKSILRLADNPRGFSAFTLAQEKALADLAAGVDLTVYSSPTLKPLVDELQPRRTLYLANGVNAAMFARPAAKPMEYAGLSKPIVVYVGAMEEWFDFDLLNQLSALAPNLEFVLIGPTHLARKKLIARPNVHMLGSRPHDALPGYLQHAAVGIIPFAVQRHTALVRHINPLKMLEYMASNLPVVSARWPYLEQSQLPVTLCDNVNEWLNTLQTLGQQAKPQYHNLASAYDWNIKAQQLLQELDLPYKRVTCW